MTYMQGACSHEILFEATTY